jgi:hypothetical protein
MRRWLPVSLFLLAVLIFFISGRIESASRNTSAPSYTPEIRNHSVARPPMHSQSTSPSANMSTQVAAYMPIMITVIFGILALWMVLSKAVSNDDERRKWALGILGIIVGYWLKG